MGDSKPIVMVTGAASALAAHLLPFLSACEVVGLDAKGPATHLPIQFASLDIAKEESCVELTSLIQQAKPVGVIHLAFDADDARTFDQDRMWHHNVAGTARVMEAVTEANRDVHIVEKFIYLSSALVYGPDLQAPASEISPLGTEDFPFVKQQVEADQVVKHRAPALRGCSVFMLRTQVLAGRNVNNYLIDAFRGIPQGEGKRAERLREKGERLSYVLPFGNDYLAAKKQFLHADDLGRLVAYILARTEPESQRLTLMNVAGRGEALTAQQCLTLARATVKRVPGKLALEKMLEYRWNAHLSPVAPEFLPYIVGGSWVTVDRLKKFLGADYESVIRYPNAEAFADSFAAMPQNFTQSSVAQK
jgi:nucleoside-diphosphate-sugar epimerase